MSMKIPSKIVGYAVKKPGEATIASPGSPAMADVIQMHETLKRPEKLIGSTYKLKTPEHVSEHAMYITINDIVLNESTEHEMRRPFEVFINSKNLDHFQWIVALTRIMSAVFRKGGDITFIVEEMRSVFDPRGGYWNNGKYMPSIIAEIGDVIERHLIDIGMLKRPELDEHQKKLIADKKAELAAQSTAQSMARSAADESGTGSGNTDSQWPENAQLCNKCQHQSAVLLDGCMTCLNCGESKCG